MTHLTGSALLHCISSDAVLLLVIKVLQRLTQTDKLSDALSVPLNHCSMQFTNISIFLKQIKSPLIFYAMLSDGQSLGF